MKTRRIRATTLKEQPGLRKPLCALTLLFYLLFLILAPGCRSNDGGGIRGGSAQDRAIVQSAFDNVYPVLHRKDGRIKPYAGQKYALNPKPPANGIVVTLRSGQQQGVLRILPDGSYRYAEANRYGMTYGTPLAGDTADHEVRHSFLHWSDIPGWMEHSSKYFDSGAVIR